MSELKCTCGVCNVCKSRERMRKKRAHESWRKGLVESRKAYHASRNETLPAQEDELVQLPDNLAIWVDGNGHSYGPDTLQGRVYVRESNITDDIKELERQFHSFSKKKRRGREYWYQWDNGSWKYVGPVDARHDPREDIETRIEARREHRQRTKELMKSCVIKELGNHLLIDIEKYREHVDKKLPGNIILVKDVVS